MGIGIKHKIGNGNGKPPQWEWELPALPWEVLCRDELIKLLVLYLPDANACCAEFADYRKLKQNANVFSIMIIND